MSSNWLIVVYGLLIVAASVGGGLIPLLIRLTHRRMQVALSFVAGAMLGVGLLHLVPHAFLELGSIDQVVLWVMAGFLVMFFIERFFNFHHHDISEDEAQCHEHHEHASDHHAQVPHSMTNYEMTWSGAAIGLSLHGLADGLALAASVSAESVNHGAAALAGFGAFLVIFLHKPFDAMTLGTLLAAGRWSPRWRHWINLLFALLVPVGALLFLLGFDRASGNTEAFLGAALAFSAGTFLCIASSDLLPELQFHQHDRGKLSAALLLGIILAWGLGFVEGGSHGHSHGHDRTADDAVHGHHHADDDHAHGRAP
jgi:zinc and cadmium transporter